MTKDRHRDFLRAITLVMGQKQQLLWGLPPIETFALNRALFDIDPAPHGQTLDELVELLELAPRRICTARGEPRSDVDRMDAMVEGRRRGARPPAGGAVRGTAGSHDGDRAGGQRHPGGVIRPPWTDAGARGA